MEARLALALAEKLRRIYEREDTFLTYPLGVAFSNSALGFMLDLTVSGLGAADQLREKVEFARNMNIVPDDRAAFSADATKFLWDRVLEVLNSATFAQSGLTAAEEGRLAEAIDYLTDQETLAGGITVTVNSAILTRYYQYKVAYDTAEATYLDEKITVETSTGPEGDALKARWAASREKQLRDAMQQALDNWNNLGAANQVKAAIATRNELELKKYVSLYRDGYVNEIKLAQIPDLETGAFPAYLTFFSPFNMFTVTAPWSKLTITRTELETLAAEATQELKQLFGSQQDVPIESVTLEYSNVTLVRPWYRPEFFQSRTWRFPDATVVSDGNVPRRGLIPGYITSILATRNITVTRAAGASGAPLTIPILNKAALTQDTRGSKLDTLTGAKLRELQLGSLAERPKIIAGAATAAVKPRIAVARMAPITDDTATAEVATPMMVRASTVVLDKTRFTQALANTNKQQILQIQRSQFIGTVIESPPIVPPPPPQQELPPPPPATPPPEQFGFDGCIVLAYICKRVPLAPNPDPNLQWP